VSVIEKARPGGGAGRGQRRGSRRGLWFLLLLAFAGACGALWWLLRDAPVVPTAAQPVVEPPPLAAGRPAASEPGGESAPEAAPEPALEPAAAEPLPPLAESDALARGLARPLSRHPLYVRLVRDAGLIDRFVLIVDNLAEGSVPRRELAELRPAGKFGVVVAGDVLRVDPASYRRYDALAEAIASLDTRAAVSAYRRVAPLCEESYRALGYPEGGFERRLSQALALLVATPTPGASPALVPETKRYEFADPALESLADAQKQLLRMGPENAARVIGKLREIEAALR
jgi:hypothetical protein